MDEDFMILLPDADGDSYSLQGYIACFSSGFDVDKMLGRKLRDLHVEVPRYQEKLQLSMERWLERLRPGKYVSRTNVRVPPSLLSKGRESCWGACSKERLYLLA